VKTLEQVQVEHIKEVLHHCHFIRSDAAKILGITVRTVYIKIKSYQLTPENCVPIVEPVVTIIDPKEEFDNAMKEAEDKHFPTDKENEMNILSKNLKTALNDISDNFDVVPVKIEYSRVDGLEQATIYFERSERPVVVLDEELYNKTMNVEPGVRETKIKEAKERLGEPRTGRTDCSKINESTPPRPESKIELPKCNLEDCQNEKLYESYHCKEHTCSRDDCNDPISIGSLFCPEHPEEEKKRMCEEDGCKSETHDVTSNWCFHHLCN